ncbi:hypothetical protein JJQ72_18880 [Paenibacillus sp. F411]|uniref:YjcQ protein n=1 Tax=Paenibacillus algicola TaxID=2565926 RepID=A0A4V1G3D5_9BACL|nr:MULTISPECIES: hypothetical protein [Paenibacillus]MBO2946045.1 hypothetical protein [Paenibacillus sp. F411]QCT00814.1 hypothetical protein E6C60_0087 [Paenibacillus algicola]
MRVGYSILKEIHNNEFTPEAKDYGLEDHEFIRMVKLLEKKGYLENILIVGDFFSLKQTKLTIKGIHFLAEHSDLDIHYPTSRSERIAWIQEDKRMYSNGAE